MAKRLDGLDALRGLAALVVVLYHFDEWSGHAGIWRVGWISVDLFFVLSGFVIARAYESRLRSDLTLREFVLLRYRRLWLPYAVGCTIGLAYLLFLGVPNAFPAYLIQLTFLPSAAVEGQYFPVNPPGWSLFYELLVNVIFAVIFAKMPTRRLLVWTAFVSIIFAVAALRVGERMGAPDFTAGFLRSLAPYLVGVCIYRLKFQPRTSGRVAVWSFPLVIIAFAYLPAGIMLASFSLIIAPLMLIGALGLQSSAGRLLGKISYPLYAVHAPIGLFGLTLTVDRIWWALGTAFAVILVMYSEGRVFQFLDRRKATVRDIAGQQVP